MRHNYLKTPYAPAHISRMLSERQGHLFEAADALPEGFAYQREFLGVAEESALLARLRGLPFQEAQYREWTAKRRVVSFGGRYDFAHHQLLPAPQMPDCLQPLRQRIGEWTGLPAESFQHVLVSEYRTGVPLGWHRDVPEFEVIVGVSLAGLARMRLRPYPPRRGQRAALTLEIEPRSIYSLRGAARWSWQHAISPTKELRYSITFRTRRRSGDSPP